VLLLPAKKGLQPLADSLLAQKNIDPELEAGKYIDDEKGVKQYRRSPGRCPRYYCRVHKRACRNKRQNASRCLLKKAPLSQSRLPGKEQEGIKYKDYFDWTEPVKSAPSHRILAMRRGEKEEILYLDIKPTEEDAIDLLEREFITARNAAATQVGLAIGDGYKRLLKPSMETEISLLTKKKADEEAIRVFAENARQLLLGAPLGQKSVLWLLTRVSVPAVNWFV
jgi:uncharacterized protein